MELSIDPKIFEQNPDLKLGVIVVKGIDNSKRNSSLESLLRGICAQKKREFEKKELDEERRISVWNQAYGKFGINPGKFPPSITALLKRVKSGKELPHINGLVDLYNYFSLKHLLPIGGEDLDWLCGDLKLTYTLGGEPFRKLSSIEVEKAAEGEIAYMDNGGITCRYWNYRECERTKLTKKTVNAALIVEDLSNMPIDTFGAILREIQNGIIKYIGGQIETYILNEENKGVDFGIQGRTSADDSKVPAQEIAHYRQGRSEAKSRKKQVEESDGLKKNKKSSKNKPEKPESQPSPKPEQLSLIPKPANFKTESRNLLKNQVKKLIEEAFHAAFPNNTDYPIKIEYPASNDHGDYASNIALSLAKAFGMKSQEIAKKIIEKIPENDLVDHTDLAGPGFINIFISKKTLDKEVEEVLTEGVKYGRTRTGRDNPVVIDYSAPNIAKPLGVHHLLSTVIGQSIYNIFKAIGYKSIGINHIGDWGTQFGKLIYAYKKWGDKKVIEKDPINELLKLYVKFHDKSEKSPEIEDAARHEFRIFEEGDEENKELWKWFVDESMKEIEKTYKKLGGVKFDYVHGESFYEDKMEAILEEGKEKGIFVKGEEGAYVVEYDDPDIAPFVVQKKDGATLYSTRDFATLKYRIDTWNPEKIIYVVDIAQSLHFKQLFKAAERFSWYGGEAVHVWFGRMRMKDGSMSTRKGDTVLLDDVIEEGIRRAEAIIKEKNPDLKGKKKVAGIVGTGAIKYNILSQNRTTDITFDWDKMLSFDGNSAPYLQYSYARAKSILRKAKEIDVPDSENPDVENSTAEKADKKTEIAQKTRELVGLFPKFAEQTAAAAKEYKPNLIANYLYELAQKFNGFYNGVPVLKAGEKEREERLRIVEAVSRIMKNGLALLCIEVVEEM